MKVNSNTISLDREDYTAVEEVIKKIASDNKIDNVNEVNVVLSSDSGTVKFKLAETEVVQENTKTEETKKEETKE
jgi:hypothetical protein